MLLSSVAMAEAYIPCTDPVQCDDGDPCTDNECELGRCRFVPNFTTCCVDDTECADHPDGCYTTTCEASVCQYQLHSLACDDGDSCTQSDACAIVCFGVFGCDDGNACTVDSCVSPNGPFVHDLTPCDDSDPCTTDHCDPLTGECISEPMCDPGLPCSPIECTNGVCAPGPTCDDGDACTTDTCDPATGDCSHQPLCDDGNPCTADSCNAGSCTHQNDDTLPCDDGNACTPDTRCVSGACVADMAAAAAPCDDKNPCTTDLCNPTTGTCIHEPAIDNSPCDDDGDLDPCTTGLCTAGECLASGQTSDCDDDNPCTTDSCTAGCGCVHEALADGTACDDDSMCTTGDSCEGGMCEGTADPTQFGCCEITADCPYSTACGPAVDCVAGPGAPTGVCEYGGGCCESDEACELMGACWGCDMAAHQCDQIACDDENPCTLDYCQNEACVFEEMPGAPCDDGDGDPCTGVCGVGVCTDDARPDGEVCDDGNPCSGAGVCMQTVCEPGQYVGGDCGCTLVEHCDDGNPCTTDVGCCDGQCENLLTPTPGCCGSDNDCNDGDPCTDDTCLGGTCLHGFVQGPGCDFECESNADCFDGSDQPINGIATSDAGMCTRDLCQGGICGNTDMCQAQLCVCCNDSYEDGNECTFDFCCSSPSGKQQAEVKAHQWDNAFCVGQSHSMFVLGDHTAHAEFVGCCASDTQCADGNPETRDTCAGGDCEITPCGQLPPGEDCCDDHLDCSDSDPTTLDRCLAGSCHNTVFGGACSVDQDCPDDGKPCTVERCVNGQCDPSQVVCCGAP
jgi:hypothetical protein